ncbi:MAG: MBL fold metallo-hydrolase [Magnetococcales bacterium]|nr:MBL fold metallo-hydrolase [Magnetococcales bacterium]
MATQFRPAILCVGCPPADPTALRAFLEADHALVCVAGVAEALVVLERGGVTLVLVATAQAIDPTLRGAAVERGLPILRIDPAGGAPLASMDGGGLPPPSTDESRSATFTVTPTQDERIRQLEADCAALRREVASLQTLKVAPGVFWIRIPEAGLQILCGCPPDVTKLLMRKGFIKGGLINGLFSESGPNAILLSDVPLQGGALANLCEFPVLQMLYRQGMILPGHPNNTGIKPLLIGCREQIQAQMNYIHRGNYGLISREEILACGIGAEEADRMWRVKLKFAFGTIRPPEAIVDTLVVEDQPVAVRNGVTVQRLGPNRYAFAFQGRSTAVDLTLAPRETYDCPYPLGRLPVPRGDRFAILHLGEGDGWHVDLPCMGSAVLFEGQLFLVDAGPGVLHSLTALGIDPSEVAGIFHSHSHDDHFAGLPSLIRTDRPLKYYATPLVRAAVTKKFCALLSLPEESFARLFDIRDLTFDLWNDCGGLEVMPLYSPHPVENNILLFRVRDGADCKTYAHLADITAFKILDGMTGSRPADLEPTFIERIKANYLLPADLKKLDIGGGLIHGLAEDFSGDATPRLLLSHLSRPFTDRELQIGSHAAFGAVDVLIPGQGDPLRQRAQAFLQAFLPEAPPAALQELLDSPLPTINPGTILHRAGVVEPHVDLIVSGTVLALDPATGTRQLLSFGTFIGGEDLFGPPIAGQNVLCRTVAHVSVLRIARPLLERFLAHHHLQPLLTDLMAKIRFLRGTWLFEEGVSCLTLSQAARHLEPVTDPSRLAGAEPALWLVVQGQATLIDDAGGDRETIGPGGFFGTDSVLSEQPLARPPRLAPETTLYRLAWSGLARRPILYWKLLDSQHRPTTPV